MTLDLEDLHVGDGCYDAIGDFGTMVEWDFLALIYLLSVFRC